MTAKSEYETMTADVSAWRIARVYAEALLKTAEKRQQEDQLLEELDSLVKDVFAASPDFENFLSNLAIGRDAKAPVIQRVLEGRASATLIDFLQVLNRHERLGLLRPVAAAYRALMDEKAHRVRVWVKTAVPLPNDQRDALMAQLHARMQRQPILELQVDPDLLGGLIVQVDDWLYDGSVRSRLQTLRNQLIERSSHEIQTGRDRFSSGG
jgi:F-type H+-transporting ATPase subunit delta